MLDEVVNEGIGIQKTENTYQSRERDEKDFQLVGRYVYQYTNTLTSVDSLFELVGNLEDLATNLKTASDVFKSEIKATIILYCLKHKVIHYRGLTKLYPNSNKYLLDTLERFINYRLLESVEGYMPEIRPFTDSMKRKSFAGGYQARNAKFYHLTPFARELFAKLEADLRKVSQHTYDIDHIQETLRQDHSDLQREPIRPQMQQAAKQAEAKPKRVFTIEDYDFFIERNTAQIKALEEKMTTEKTMDELFQIQKDIDGIMKIRDGNISARAELLQAPKAPPPNSNAL